MAVSRFQGDGYWVDEPECGRRDEQEIFPGAPTYYQRKGDECPYRVVCAASTVQLCINRNLGVNAREQVRGRKGIRKQCVDRYNR